MRSTFQFAIIVVAYCLETFYRVHFFLIALTILAVSLNLHYFFKDKRDLADATYYVRSKKSTSFFEIMQTLVILGVFGFGIYYLFNLIPEKIKFNGASPYLAIIMLAPIFGNYYTNFRTSVRTYDYGIVLPKYRNTLYRWSSINKIDLEENRLTIELKGEKPYIFNFDPKDLEHAVDVKNQFEAVNKISSETPLKS